MQVRGKIFHREESDNSPGLTLSIERQITGHGNIDLLCGACFAVIAEKMEKSWFKSDVPLRCPKCKAWNEIPNIETIH